MSNNGEVRRVVEVFPAIRSSRFDLPLTYETGDLELSIGDIVRAPLANRETLGYVISEPASIPATPKLRAIASRADVPRAFDSLGLELAYWMAEHYLCTLGEALRAVILANAVPRSIDQLRKISELPPRANETVTQRLVDLIWQDLPHAFELQTLLHHPHARRAGDRATLLRAISTLVAADKLERQRTFVGPRVLEYRLKVLQPGDVALRGPKLTALLDFVREHPGVPRANALLAGFSAPLIARAIREGGLREEDVVPVLRRQRHSVIPPLFEATAEQRQAIERLHQLIGKKQFACVLLHGITGSGKTFVYIEAIKRVVARGERALVLVPEISLTPQTARRFEQAFGDGVAVLHSALSERERYEAWQACARGDIDVVVGARSAVFAPLQSVRLLIVDEAHESSYKQDSVPRYNAVAVARHRMKCEGGVLLLGSATPSLESFAAATAGNLELLRLSNRASDAALPMTRVVDMATEFQTGNRRSFSNQLTQALAQRLERGEKTVLFVNRRGSASFILCRACGYVSQCRRCSVSMAVHRSENLLRCHYCDAQKVIPVRCPSCAGDSIREFGIGTQGVVDEVQRLFPKARVVRMDSDTTTRIGDHARLLNEFQTNADVLVGTQMVAKGLDFPQVTLVGVIAADIGLHVADFRASERTFALITQVCGRSGRASPGEALIQTYAPAHPAISFAAHHDYCGFARHELAERKALGYPPFKSLMYLGIIGRNRAEAARVAENVAAILRKNDGSEVLGPAPYPVGRLNDEWRFRIAVKTSAGSAFRSYIRKHIVPLAKASRATRFVFNVDP